MKAIACLFVCSAAVAAYADPPKQIAAPACTAKDVGWRKVPDGHGKPIKTLCGGCELHYGRRCSKTHEVIDLRCMFTPGPPPPGRPGGGPGGGPPHHYDEFDVVSCTSTPHATGVVWDAVYCDKPAAAGAKYPSCGETIVKHPPK